MDYLFLDEVSWQHSQALYHAACYLNREVLLILRPASPYVCVGFHQDARQEIDLMYAAANQIPVFRREVGGGAVYLDGNQLFYQLVLHQDHPAIPASKSEFYKKFLTPVIETFVKFGVPAQYKPVNDIMVQTRKISGNGAAQIADCIVLVGNFILDFDYEMMSRVLRTPDEKFRDKVYKTMKENLTTIRRETGGIPSTQDLAAALVENFKPLLGMMDSGRLDETLLKKAEEVIDRMDTPEWLLAQERSRPKSSQVKISQNVWVTQNIHKAPGGLIRATVVNSAGILTGLHLSGDFFFYPAEQLADLETILIGGAFKYDVIEKRISDFYVQNQIESPGVEPADIARSIFSL
ncbi:MAG: lipoate--protein ligase family protein [Anaerolineaceae bacterium]|nr:lipoate--protein ligase family protein [Anaerolineaceae bacterium]